MRGGVDVITVQKHSRTVHAGSADLIHKDVLVNSGMTGTAGRT